MQAIFNVAVPIFGVILAGYLAGYWRILGSEATGALNAFVSYFALPVLFFGTLARTPVRTVLDPALTQNQMPAPMMTSSSTTGTTMSGRVRNRGIRRC